MTDERIFVVYAALKKGVSVDEVFNITKIDRWFLNKFKNLIAYENLLESGVKLTKEIYVPAFKEITDVVRMAKAGIEQMWINRDILANDIYKYLFTVEDVNDAVAKGVPFRDAYREVGMRVQNGTYEHDGRELNHTHEGSIGNLCNDRISALMNQVVEGFNFATMEEAEKSLLGR